MGKKEYSCFIEAVCPVCGKDFYPTPEWAYNNGDKKNFRKVCSYSCHNAARNNRKKGKRERDREMMEARNREIYRLSCDGKSNSEIAKIYGVSTDRIWQIVVKMKSLEAVM